MLRRRDRKNLRLQGLLPALTTRRWRNMKGYPVCEMNCQKGTKSTPKRLTTATLCEMHCEMIAERNCIFQPQACGQVCLSMPELWSDMERSFCLTGFYHEIVPVTGHQTSHLPTPLFAEVRSCYFFSVHIAL